MRQQSVLLGLAAALPSALAWAEPNLNPLAPRQTGDSDERPLQDVLCKPESDASAPCINIEAIEVRCAPNGTEPIHLDAHAQCMCKGSFFAEKLGCERCLNVHGLRSEREYLHYGNVLRVVSEELCSGTPTAAFASIFSWVQETQPTPTTGETGTTVTASSAMDVSVYYTASGPQGAGRIEGAAASATDEVTSEVNTTADETTRTSAATTSSTDGAEESEETGETEGTTTTDGSGAMPTAAAGGIAWGIAGAVILAAL